MGEGDISSAPSTPQVNVHNVHAEHSEPATVIVAVEVVSDADVKDSPALPGSQSNSPSSTDLPLHVTVTIVDDAPLAAAESRIPRPTTPSAALPPAAIVIAVPSANGDAPGRASGPSSPLGSEPSVLPFVHVPRSIALVSLRRQCYGFVMLFLVVMYFMCMVLTVTTWRYPDPATQLQLPDIMLDTLPLVPELEHATDLLLGVLVAMCFTTIGCLYLVSKGKLDAVDSKLLAKYGPVDTLYMVPWIRFFVCYTAVTALRIIVVGSTVLPATNNQCRLRRPDTGNIWWNSFVGVVTLGSANVHCGDLLFSGHTSVIILATLAVWQYGPIVHRTFRPLAVCLMVMTWFTILMSRSHYTDDIVVALYFSCTLWALIPHDGVRGAPAVWHLLIQNPVALYRKIRSASVKPRPSIVLP